MKHHLQKFLLLCCLASTTLVWGAETREEFNAQTEFKFIRRFYLQPNDQKNWNNIVKDIREEYDVHARSPRSIKVWVELDQDHGQEEGGETYYPIKKIAPVDEDDLNGAYLQLNTDLLQGVLLNRDARKDTISLGRKIFTTHNITETIRYAMFWYGGMLFYTDEVLGIKANNEAMMEVFIQNYLKKKKSDKDDKALTDKEKRTIEILKNFDLYTCGFNNLGDWFWRKSSNFPILAEKGFPGSIQRAFSRRGRLQAINIAKQIWADNPTPHALIATLWPKAEKIERYEHIRDTMNGYLKEIWNFKWKLLILVSLVTLAYISLSKVLRFSWDNLFKKLLRKSYLPKSSTKSYTHERNILIRFADAYMSPAFAKWLRRYLKKKGLWKENPPIRTTLFIAPNAHIEKVVEEIKATIRNTIKLNTMLIKQGKRPIYCLPNIIFYGDPGNGKTTVARAILAELMAAGLVKGFEINIPEFAELNLQEAAGLWREMASQEDATHPTIYILNEFDDIALKRNGNKTNDIKRTHLNSFLATYTDKGSPYSCCIITMNTMLNDKVQRALLDAAFLRRCEAHLIGDHTKENIIRILLIHLRDKGRDVGLALKQIPFLKAELAKHPYLDRELPGSEGSHIAQKVVLKKSKRFLKRAEKGKISTKKQYILLQDILEVLDYQEEVMSENEEEEYEEYETSAPQQNKASK